MAHTCVRSPGRCPMPPSVIPMSVNMRVPGVLRILSLRAALRRKEAELECCLQDPGSHAVHCT